MMKNIYETPELKIIEYVSKDILLASGEIVTDAPDIDGGGLWG